MEYTELGSLLLKLSHKSREAFSERFSVKKEKREKKEKMKRLRGARGNVDGVLHLTASTRLSQSQLMSRAADGPAGCCGALTHTLTHMLTHTLTHTVMLTRCPDAINIQQPAFICVRLTCWHLCLQQQTYTHSCLWKRLKPVCLFVCVFLLFDSS